MAETMSIRDGARYLGIGYDALCAHVREGRLTTIQFEGSKRKRLTKAALDAFIAASSCGPLNGPTEESPSPEVSGNKARLTAFPKRTKGAPYQWIQQYAAK